MRSTKIPALLVLGWASASCHSGSDSPPPATSLSGSWSGTIGDEALLNLTLMENPAPGGAVTGTAYVVSLESTTLLAVEGFGSIPEGYTLGLLPSPASFELRIVGSLSGAGFTGTYDIPLGTGASLGLSGSTGPVSFDAAPPDGIGGRFFRGEWEPVGAGVVMAFGQNGTTVRGIVTWTGYDCASQALLEGRLTGPRLVASLRPVTDPATPEFGVDLRWDPGGNSLSGAWAVTDRAFGGGCGTTSRGTTSLAEFAFGSGHADELVGERAFTLHVLREEIEGGSMEVVYAVEDTGLGRRAEILCLSVGQGSSAETTLVDLGLQIADALVAAFSKGFSPRIRASMPEDE